MARAPWSRPPTLTELGAIAHGPVVLAEAPGRFVGLRSAVLYSWGLYLSVVVIGQGVYAEAMQLQHRPEPLAKGRWKTHGNGITFRAIDSSVPLMLVTSGRGEGNSGERFYQESLYVLDPFNDDHLVVATAWPEVGIEESITRLQLPELSELEMAIIPLP